jgi:hypothetical protein
MLLYVIFSGVIRIMLFLIVRLWGHGEDANYLGFFGSGGVVDS